MAQIKPVAVDVGSKYKNAVIGYSIRTLEDKVYSKFTTKAILKSDVPDIFYTSAIVPTAGGYIVWGIESQDLFFDTIEPCYEIPDFSATLDQLYKAISQLVIPNPDIVMNVDTTEFIKQVESVKTYVLNAVSDSNVSHIESVRELCIRFDELTANYNKLSVINSVVEQHSKMESLRLALNEFMLGKSVTIDTKLDTPESTIEPIIAKLTELNNDKMKTRKQLELTAISKFLDSVSEA